MLVWYGILVLYGIAGTCRPMVQQGRESMPVDSGLEKRKQFEERGYGTGNSINHRWVHVYTANVQR